MKRLLVILLVTACLKGSGQGILAQLKEHHLNYLPLEKFENECSRIWKVDTLLFLGYVFALEDFGAPSIYGKEVKSPVFRFLHTRPFDPDALFTLHLTDKPYVEILTLPYSRVRFSGNYHHHFVEEMKLRSKKEKRQLKELRYSGASPDSVNNFFGRKIVVHKEDVLERDTIVLSASQLSGFQEKLREISFSQEVHVDHCWGDDGEWWLMETNVPEYHFVARWSPRGTEIYELGKLIWELSNLKNEAWYLKE